MKRYWDQLFAAIRIYLRGEGPLLAAAIAYYLAFSLFPLMLVLVAVLGWAFRSTVQGVRAEQQVLQTIREQASPELGEQVAAALSSVESSAGAGGAIGAVTLIAAAIAVFSQIDYAFDRLWENSTEAKVTWRTRVWNIVFTRLKAALMLMGVGAFVIAVMIASIVWQAVQTNWAPVGPLGAWLSHGMQPFLHVALNSLAFASCYRFLPKTVVHWRPALAGGLLASVLWEVGRQVLAAYVVGDKLPSAYGVIGSFMAIMLWTYYAMIVVLFGAAYCRAANEATGSQSVAAAAR